MDIALPTGLDFSTMATDGMVVMGGVVAIACAGIIIYKLCLSGVKWVGKIFR